MNKFVITDLDYVIEREEDFGRFLLPFKRVYPPGERRFRGAGDVVERCLSWIWYQWLKGLSRKEIITVAEAVISKSLQLQKEESDFYWRADHDLACAHLAVIFGDQSLMSKVAEQLVFSEAKIESEICQLAWSGLWKFWLLGDIERAKAEAELMYQSPRPINLRLPRKPVVRAWLTEDWKSFGKALKGSYTQSWASLKGCNDFEAISDKEVKFSLKRKNSRVMGHWQENAFALFAARRGVEVPTDGLWLPRGALN